MNIAVNKYCPRSGKPVSSDSLTEYAGATVGFCNPGCRDDFQNNTNDRPADRAYFDAVIKEFGSKVNVDPSHTSSKDDPDFLLGSGMCGIGAEGAACETVTNGVGNFETFAADFDG